MQIRLCALGRELNAPLDRLVEVESIDAAVEAAEVLLQSNPRCESVEVFFRGRFLTQVDRRLH